MTEAGNIETSMKDNYLRCVCGAKRAAHRHDATRVESDGRISRRTRVGGCKATDCKRFVQDPTQGPYGLAKLFRIG